MSIQKYKNKKKTEKIIDKIIQKIIDIIFFPLRVAYKKYENSNLKNKRIVKKAYKKLMNHIYRELLDGRTFLTDFYVSEDHKCCNIISLYSEYALTSYQNKSAKELFDEIVLKLSKDNMIEIKQREIKEVFRSWYSGYERENGRVIEINLKESESR